MSDKDKAFALPLWFSLDKKVIDAIKPLLEQQSRRIEAIGNELSIELKTLSELVKQLHGELDKMKVLKKEFHRGSWKTVDNYMSLKKCLKYREIVYIVGRPVGHMTLKKRGYVKRGKGVWCKD